MDCVMLKKTYTKTGKFCRVTFKYRPEVEKTSIQLVGDFNDWGEKKKHMLKKCKDGSFSLTLSLPSNSDYHFRYFCNDNEWQNDEAADSYERNSFGSQNGVLSV